MLRLKKTARRNIMSRGFGSQRSVLFLTVLLCLVFVVSLVAKDTAKIQFVKEKHDFGKVDQGKVLTYSFKFKNVGDAPLTINNVRTTCGCTAAVVKGKKLNPGKEGEIKITFNTTGYGGNVSKYVYVETNDPAAAQKQLTVSAAIDVPPAPRIELDNYSNDLGLILDTEAIDTQTRIKNSGELELLIEFAHKDAQFFQGNEQVKSKISVAAGKSIDITIKMPARGRTGLLREYVMIKSNDTRRPTLSLYLSGYSVSTKQLKELFKKYESVLK